MPACTERVIGYSGHPDLSPIYLDEDTILYPCGLSLVKERVSSGGQQVFSLAEPWFTTGSSNTPRKSTSKPQKVTCCELSRDRKLVAVATTASQHGNAVPTVHIINVKTWERKRSFPIHARPGFGIDALTFSTDMKHIFIFFEKPVPLLQEWLWDKRRMTKELQFPMFYAQKEEERCMCYLQELAHSHSKISVHPGNSTFIAITRSSSVHFVRRDSTDFKLLPVSPLRKQQQCRVFCHAWVKEQTSESVSRPRGKPYKLLVGCDRGGLAFFDGLDYKGIVDTEIHGDIRSIAKIDSGFVLGCDDGHMVIYTQTDGGKKPTFFQFSVAKMHRVRNCEYPIVNISVYNKGRNFLAATGDQQLYVLINVPDSNSKTETSSFEYFSVETHSKKIVDMDLCHTNPTLTSIGSDDQSLRVWNYLENTLTLRSFFKYAPNAIAMHPNGLLVLIGFPDKLRMMAIMHDQMKSVFEIPGKGFDPRSLAFSKGGNAFAFCSGTQIMLHDSHTGELIRALSGHSSKVRSLDWNFDDTKIVSCGWDSKLIEWEIHSGKQISENKAEALKYCLAYHCRLDSIPQELKDCVYVVSKDTKIIEFRKGKRCADLNIDGKITAIDFFSSACEPEIQKSPRKNKNMPISQTLVVGTEDGSLIYVPVPLCGIQTAYRVHSSPITKIRVNSGSGTVVSSDKHGIMIFQQFYTTQELMKRAHAGIEMDIHETTSSEKIVTEGLSNSSFLWDDETLIHQDELKALYSDLKKEKERAKRIQENGQQELEMKTREYENELHKLSEKFKKEIERELVKYNRMSEQMKEEEIGFQKNVEDIKHEHQKKASKIREIHAKKMELESNRVDDLKNQMKMTRESWKKEESEKYSKFKSEISEVHLEFQKKLESCQQECEKTRQEKLLLHEYHENLKKEIELDADYEISKLVSEYGKELEKQKISTSKLRSENKMLKEKHLNLSQSVAFNSNRIEKGLETEQRYLNEITRLEKEISGLENEVVERDRTIKDKTKRIISLTTKNQELEKFKFVLDYKIRELNRQIQPRETAIDSMMTRLDRMEQEKEQSHSKFEKVSRNVSILTMKAIAKYQDFEVSKTVVRDSQNQLDVTKRSVLGIFNEINFLNIINRENLDEIKNNLLKMKRCKGNGSSILLGENSSKKCNETLLHLGADFLIRAFKKKPLTTHVKKHLASLQNELIHNETPPELNEETKKSINSLRKANTRTLIMKLGKIIRNPVPDIILTTNHSFSATQKFEKERRTRAHLNDTLFSLKAKIKKARKDREIDIAIKQNDRAKLLKQINILRKRLVEAQEMNQSKIGATYPHASSELIK